MQATNPVTPGHRGPCVPHGVLLSGADPAGSRAPRPSGRVPPPVEVLLGDGGGGGLDSRGKSRSCPQTTAVRIWRAPCVCWVNTALWKTKWAGRAGHLQHTVREGQAMADAGHFGEDKIRERIADVQAQWAALEQLAAVRKRRLEEACSLHQFQADADDVDAWTLDALRIVSTADVGHDEFSTQALVKKHKDASAEVASYRSVIDALTNRPSPCLQSRCRLLTSTSGWRGIEERYKEVSELTRLRETGPAGCLGAL